MMRWLTTIWKIVPNRRKLLAALIIPPSGSKTVGGRTCLSAQQRYRSCYFCKQTFLDQTHCVFNGLDGRQLFFAGLESELAFHAYGYFKNSQGIKPEVPFIRGRVMNLVYSDTGYAADCFLDFGLD